MKKTIGLIAVIVVLLGGIFAGVHYLNKEEDQKEPASSEETENKSFSSTVTSYESYAPEDTSFGYLIASVKVDTDMEEVSLSHFTTSEGIGLHQVKAYQDQIQELPDDLDDEIDGDGTYQIFIPVKNKNLANLAVENDLSKDIWNFKLNFNEETAEPVNTEQPNSTDQPVEQNGTSLRVRGLYGVNAAFCLENGSPVSLPSSAHVFCATVNVEDAPAEGVTFSGASFITENGLTFNCEDAGFVESGYSSALNRTMRAGDSGNLYFIVYAEGDGSAYNGTLNLTESDGSTMSVTAMLS
jgi:hypothetical protein